MKNLILAENYPHPDHPETQAFIHTRCLYYKDQNLKFEVLSFRAEDDYLIDGIKVNSAKNFELKDDLEICIVHAPNLRNHIRFLIKNSNRIKKILFIFHGFEGLLTAHRTSAPSWKNALLLLRYFVQSFYDILKLPLLRASLLRIKKQIPCHFVFVSKSLQEEIKIDLKVDEEFFKPYEIINNPINPIFYEKQYVDNVDHNDVVCLRPFDDLKYGVDLFIEIARKFPERRFFLFGKGCSLDNRSLPTNLFVTKRFFKADEIPSLLAQYKAAILFTRWDSQGILACEFAAYGIPLLVSDLPICREMLAGMDNVRFVPNSLAFDLDFELNACSPPQNKCRRFDFNQTTLKELQLIRQILALP
jgi:hypothetical protein